jgi:dolichyl-diphosphooligosaccharide--protein glycosyltransferase
MSNNKESDEDKNAEDVKIDISKIKKFFSAKRMQIIILLVLLLVPTILTIYIRVQPWNMPATDSWAQNSVYNYYKNNIAQQVETQYPNLPALQKQKLVDQQFAEFQKNNQQQLDEQIKQTSTYFKSGFQYQENNNTYTFLGDLDSYYYLRSARNLKEKGMVCDQIINNTCWDTYQYAPVGGSMGTAFMHPLGMFYTYKFLHLFNPKINLMQAAFILPTILAIIGVIAAFFIGRRIINSVAGFFAAMFIALSPLLISRTLGSDTDIWNVMFPMVIILLFLEAIESKKLLIRIILASVAGFFIGVFSFAWGGWWYIFVFLILAIFAYLAFEIIKDKIHKKSFMQIFKKLLPEIYITLALIISSMIFVTIFSSFTVFIYAFISPVQISSSLKIAANANLWPNVYTTVAELNEASISTIVGQVSFGSNILFTIALLGIIFSMVKKKPDFKEYMLIAISAIIYLILISAKAMSMNPYLYLVILMAPVAIAVIMLFKEKESVIDVKMAFLLTIWFVGMIYASQKGVRFILLLTPVFAISLGVAIGYVYQYLSRLLDTDFHLNKHISELVAFLLVCLLLIAPIQAGIATGKSYMPSMTKGWWDTLTKIREETKPDSIINSWWDFGHWFKYVADRRVSLDGSGQNHPNAHWLGLTLQTDDENQSVAILRMLDCGSNNAFEEIDKKYKDTEVSENIVSDIILLSKEEAREKLSELGYSNDEIEKILRNTHCNPPDDYFITSEDMVGKAGVWAHFGLWNFDRSYIITNLRNKPMTEAVNIMKNRWNYSEEEATKIYYDIQALQTDNEMNQWISPWPGYASNNMISCVKSLENMVYCDTNIGVGGNSQQSVVIEKAVVNLSDPKRSQAILGIYDKTSGTRLGQNNASWDIVFVADKEMEKYVPENPGLSLALLLNVQNENNNTYYSALIADPLLISSTFTKLFFLDGKYMEHFEKFSDITDITGTRIIVWKVKW